MRQFCRFPTARLPQSTHSSFRVLRKSSFDPGAMRGKKSENHSGWRIQVIGDAFGTEQTGTPMMDVILTLGIIATAALILSGSSWRDDW
jgi:hypothetical protein